MELDIPPIFNADDFAKDIRAQLNAEPERYAMYTREYLGWGVFALMARA